MSDTPLDRLLGEEQQMIASAVRDFARDEVLPRHEALDHEGVHPEALWEQIAELGLFGVFLSEDAGGAGAGFLGHTVVVESLARAAGIAGILPVAQGIVTGALLHAGGHEELLEGLVTGQVLGAPALAEDDDSVVKTTAVGSEEVVLSGCKANVPYPGRAGAYLVRALRDGEPVLVLVEGGADGLRHEGPSPVLGFAGFEVGALHLDGAKGRVLGGSELVSKVMTEARIAVSALLAGLSRGALDHGARYSTERQQFKLELRAFPAMQERLARSDARTEAVRSLVHLAARTLDEGADANVVARQARLFAHETAIAVADDVVQVYGGFGYSREYPAERFYRDARFPGFGEHHHNEAIGGLTGALT